MYPYLFILLIVILGCIVYQDFTFRGISWFIFPLLFLATFFLSYISHAFQIVLHNMLINLALVALIYISLVVYESFKRKKLAVNLSGVIGLGDILFFICIMPVFSPFNFIFYLVLGLVISLVLSLFLVKIFGKETIPLAGILAGFYSIVFVVDFQFYNLQFFNDAFLISKLSWY